MIWLTEVTEGHKYENLNQSFTTMTVMESEKKVGKKSGGKNFKIHFLFKYQISAQMRFDFTFLWK